MNIKNSLARNYVIPCLALTTKTAFNAKMNL